MPVREISSPETKVRVYFISLIALLVPDLDDSVYQAWVLRGPQ